MDNAKNFAKVTVDGTYDDTETSVNVIAFDGAKLPTVPFNAVWWNATDYPDPADDPSVEIVRVTAISTDTLTVARGEEGPSPGTGFEHALEGKLYRMVAGLTAASANLLAPISQQGETFQINTGSGDAYIGDVDVAGNGTGMRVQDATGKVIVECGAGGFVIGSGKFALNDYATASVGVGVISKKIPIYDASDLTTPIGYLPLYATIT